MKTYTISLTFTDVVADNPLEATKKVLKQIIEDGNTLMYDVEDEKSEEKFTVDLDNDSVTKI